MVLFFASTILAVVAYRFIPVYFTPLMFIRAIETKSVTMHHHWIPLEESHVAAREAVDGLPVVPDAEELCQRGRASALMRIQSVPV